MKHAFSRRLMAALMVSGSLFSSACTQSGDPLANEAASLQTATQELRKVPLTHVDLRSDAGGLVTDGYTGRPTEWTREPTTNATWSDTSWGWLKAW